MNNKFINYSIYLLSGIFFILFLIKIEQKSIDFLVYLSAATGIIAFNAAKVDWSQNINIRKIHKIKTSVTTMVYLMASISSISIAFHFFLLLLR
jgi:hypothetical protein